MCYNVYVYQWGGWQFIGGAVEMSHAEDMAIQLCRYRLTARIVVEPAF